MPALSHSLFFSDLLKFSCLSHYSLCKTDFYVKLELYMRIVLGQNGFTTTFKQAFSLST